MSQLVRFGVSIEEELLAQFDERTRQAGYATRSKAIADLIKQYVVEHQWEHGGIVAGAVTIHYEHHNKDMLAKLMDLQHDYHDVIISIQHIHLDRHTCLEIIAVKGDAGRIRALHQGLQGTRGIKQAHVSITAPD